MGDPAPLKKFLGGDHHIQKVTKATGDVVTKCAYRMRDPLQAAVADYVADTG